MKIVYKNAQTIENDAILDTMMIQSLPFTSFVLQTVSNAKIMLFVKPVTHHLIKK